MATIQYHHHGRFPVVGGIIPDAITAYQTFGEENKPCIVFPTCYGGKLAGEFSVTVYLIRIDDTRKWPIRSDVYGWRRQSERLGNSLRFV